MPITPFRVGRTFEPEQITIMSAAFADTCKALGLSEADHPLTPLVAQHVMGLGQRGVISRAVIYLLTLEEFRSYRRDIAASVLPHILDRATRRRENAKAWRLMLGQHVCDALFDRFVLRPQ
jgi:hypothetical protein